MFHPMGMAQTENLVGMSFNRWTVIAPPSVERKVRYHFCRCVCGTERWVYSPNLKNGLSASCGCLISEASIRRLTTHGKAKTHLYMIWGAMMGRCNNPKNKGYAYYGGRGIFVCKRWLSFINFSEDMEGTWVKGLSIDRKDVNGPYAPWNCVWIPRGDQAKNRRPSSEWTFKKCALRSQTVPTLPEV